MFDNIFNIVMDCKGKTKENVNARKDLSIYCNRPNYELIKKSDGSTSKPRSPYTLGKEQKKWCVNGLQI